MNMIHKKYKIRPFQSGDEENILDLWKAAFHSTMSFSLFKWKYLDNPYSQAENSSNQTKNFSSQTMMLCISDTDNIVAFYGGVPYMFQWGDKNARVVQLMDIMTHPDHRQNKVFASTALEFTSAYCSSGNLLLMYGFPGEFHYAVGEKKLNYQKMGKVLYLKASVQKLLDSAEETDIEQVQTEQLYTEQVQTGHIKNMKNEHSFFNDAWNQNKQYYQFSIVRDAAFVKWRFFNHPEKEYIVLKFMDRDQTLSWAVIKIEGKKAVLVDLLVSDTLLNFKGVINAVGKYLADINVDDILTWLPENHFSAQHALLSGFADEQEPIGIISTVALFDHSPSIDWLKSNFYYSMGDSDLY